MFYRSQDKDTICAVATPQGVGGIGVIRVSGDHALEITRKIAKQIPSVTETHTSYFTQLIDLDGSPIDEGLVAYFANGRSYTGEETTEISFHGSPAIGRNLVRQLIKGGARHAGPGEFTYRAFINGKLDLIQAESVLALIESQSELSARHALRNLKGGLSSDVSEIENEMIGILANLEANLDYSEENLEVEAKDSLLSRMRACLEKVNHLKSTYEQGRVLREGLRVAIYGEPNVGKSSLMNALVREDRAIVSAQAGTTRDTVETELYLGGTRAILIDTAGVRESSDEIELSGIQRTQKEVDAADIVVCVVDATQLCAPLKSDNEQAKYIYVANKADLLKEPLSQTQYLSVSAKTGEGLERLRSLLEEKAEINLENLGSVAFQSRHFELLTSASHFLFKGIEQLETDASPEFVIAETQYALFSLMEILGKRFDDEVMDRVFSEFCIGK